MKLFVFFLSLIVFTLQLSAQATVGLEGQVVCCADCWLEADRTKVEYGTAENLSKAKSCTDNGGPDAAGRARRRQIYALPAGTRQIQADGKELVQLCRQESRGNRIKKEKQEDGSLCRRLVDSCRSGDRRKSESDRPRNRGGSCTERSDRSRLKALPDIRAES